MMTRWWRRTSVENPSTEQLLKRVVQLEKTLGAGGGRVLHRHMEDYVPFAHAGVIRDENDEIQGVFDPQLGAFMLDPEVRGAGAALMDKLGERLPENVKRALERAADSRFGDAPYATASGLGWRDVLTPRRVLGADGVQVLNTASETIMVPDFTFLADYFEVGDAFKYTLLGDLSGQAAANTVTFRLRYGGVGGTSMAASGAFAWDPTASSTTLSHMVEYYFVCRATGTAGSFFTMGRLTPADFDDASVAALVANLNMLMIPPSAPAVVGSLDTTLNKAISPTVQFSSATATVQWTNHIAILESLN